MNTMLKKLPRKWYNRFIHTRQVQHSGKRLWGYLYSNIVIKQNGNKKIAEVRWLKRRQQVGIYNNTSTRISVNPRLWETK